MKAKEYEKEIEKKLRSILRDFEILIPLFEAYEKEASDKRKIKFEKKLCKKYEKRFSEVFDEDICF